MVQAALAKPRGVSCSLAAPWQHSGGEGSPRTDGARRRPRRHLHLHRPPIPPRASGLIRGSAAASSGWLALAQRVDNEYDYLLKIVLIGDSSVDESNILLIHPQWFCLESKFTSHTPTTVGAQHTACCCVCSYSWSQPTASASCQRVPPRLPGVTSRRGSSLAQGPLLSSCRGWENT